MCTASCKVLLFLFQGIPVAVKKNDKMKLAWLFVRALVTPDANGLQAAVDAALV